MATIQFKKGDEYLIKISRLAAASKEQVCGKAIYGAADIVANEIRNQLINVPTDEKYGTESDMANGPRKIQKKGLYDSLGIASMQTDSNGDMNVKIGFDGYNEVKTKAFPNGQPNQMVARSVERGTSFMKANAFVKKAVSASKENALNKIKSTVDEEIKKIMEG